MCQYKNQRKTYFQQHFNVTEPISNSHILIPPKYFFLISYENTSLYDFVLKHISFLLKRALHIQVYHWVNLIYK